jgi:hypothetical protein
MLKDDDYVWYAAYGSNIKKLDRYLPELDFNEVATKWISEGSELYFAGESARWQGGVAFVAPQLPSDRLSELRKVAQNKDERVPFVLYKLFRITLKQFKQVFDGENNGNDTNDVSYQNLLETREIHLGDEHVKKMRAVDMPLSEDGKKGKYNGILRLEDTLFADKFEPVYTITTARQIEKNEPSQAYLDTIAEGLELVDSEDSKLASGIDIEAYLRDSIQHDPGKYFFRKGAGAILDNVGEADQIYVSANDANLLGVKSGGWLLGDVGDVVVPVKMKVRDDLLSEEWRNRYFGTVNTNYAFRALVGLEKIGDELLDFQPFPLEQKSFFARVQSYLNAFGNWLVGAPSISLRSVEGLVGDDGDLIVRADETALARIGVKSGDEVILSWGNKEIIVQALKHSSDTVTRMRSQLEEKGSQTRRKSNFQLIESRKQLPMHLIVWVSASVRNQLNIPTDSLVRIRRRPWRTLWMMLPDLSVPLMSLVLAVFALPDRNTLLIGSSMAFVVLVGLVLLSRVRMKN